MCGDGKEAFRLFRFICLDENCRECRFYISGKCTADNKEVSYEAV